MLNVTCRQMCVTLCISVMSCGVHGVILQARFNLLYEMLQMGGKAVATECFCVGDNDIGIYLCSVYVSVGRKIKM